MAESQEERRKRLRALRSAAEETEAKEPEPVLKFRNYAPRDKQGIEHTKIEAAQPPEFVEPVQEAADGSGEGNGALPGVAAKKANWDLRRDVEKQLAKLEKRTARACIQLMQQAEQEGREV